MMMSNSNYIVKIYKDSFKINLYTVHPFRMIGLINVDIQYSYGIEKVTLAFYSSSGTNSGKIKDLWYPIVGIKTTTGNFTEFTDYLNFILSLTTKTSYIKRGWLAKSPFFYTELDDTSQLRGFANGKYYDSLLELGKTLRNLYNKGEYHHLTSLKPTYLNKAVTSSKIYPGNGHTQRENFEKYIEDIFIHARPNPV